MLNEGLRNSPSAITSILKTEDVEFAPGLRTVERYMNLIRKGSLSYMPLRKWFEWPQDMGPRDDQVPWVFSRYALDCLAFYVENHGQRPMIGLTQRFGWVACSSPGWSDEQRAVLAEQLWYADLVASIPGRKRPSTTYSELRLATSKWNLDEQDILDPLQKSREIEHLVVPQTDGPFIRYMPEFGKRLKVILDTEWEER